jgi:putative component of membrane protein insertase Oxa1/YidC/SpoIIIJ protein YidD
LDAEKQKDGLNGKFKTARASMGCDYLSKRVLKSQGFQVTGAGLVPPRQARAHQRRDKA